LPFTNYIFFHFFIDILWPPTLIRNDKYQNDKYQNNHKNDKSSNAPSQQVEHDSNGEDTANNKSYSAKEPFFSSS
jgi:hypothetical protein